MSYTPRGTCRGPECTSDAATLDGLCRTHHDQARRGERLRPKQHINTRRTRGTCQVGTGGRVCGRPNHARGMCGSHHRRWLRTGDPGPVDFGTPSSPRPGRRRARDLAGV